MAQNGGCLVLLLLLFSFFSPSLQDPVTISVKGVTTIAKTDDTFVCVTIDWWPKEKCNYGMCPWGQSSIINLDLTNPILFKALKAFKNLRVRLGGSLQDQVYYKIGRDAPRCRNFGEQHNGTFGFSTGCLTMERWDELNRLFRKTGSILTFGINALNGRTKGPGDLYTGDWDPTNAHDFIKYTVSKGFNIESYEFGNELSASGVSGRVLGSQYGKDMVTLKKVITELYANQSRKPKLLGPGGFFETKWFADMLQSSGPGVIDAVTHHIYNLGAGVDPNLFYKMQDPYLLSQIAQTYYDVEQTIRNFGPWSSAWVSESGGAYNSGGRLVSHAFVDSFWFLDQLGMTSTFNHKAFCRQALIGGNYALLNTTNFIPNPDYYSALLFHKLMGPGVLETTHDGSPYLRAYTHCSRRRRNGVTMLLINLSNSTSFEVSVANDMNLYPPQLARYRGTELVSGVREEYHLTPEDGNLKSTVMLLNGVPLQLTCEGNIPEMHPNVVLDGSAPVKMAPSSIAFIKFRDFKAPACGV